MHATHTRPRGRIGLLGNFVIAQTSSTAARPRARQTVAAAQQASTACDVPVEGQRLPHVDSSTAPMSVAPPCTFHS